MKINLFLPGCNCNCIFCFRRNNTKNIESFEEIVKKIDAAPADASFEFASDECTIHPDFLKIVDYISNKGSKFTIMTNGRMLSNDRFLRHLQKKGLHHVTISLHSCNEEHHEMITQTKGSFEQAVKGIRNCVSLKIPIAVNIVLCSINIADFTQTCRMIIEDLKVKDITILALLYFNNVQFIDYKKIVLPYDKISCEIYKVAQYLKDKKINLGFEHIPLCVLKKDNLYEKIVPMNEKINTDFTKKLCDDCTKKDVCMGIPVEYYQRFGLCGISKFL